MTKYYRSAAIGAVAALIAAALLPVASPPANAASCDSYEFVAARGSGELDTLSEADKYTAANGYGMGPRLYPVYTKLKELAPALSINPYGVHYPAVQVDGWGLVTTGVPEALHLGAAFNASVAVGKSDILTELTKANNADSAKCFILAGYSQGAQAVGDALQSMSSSLKSHVAATVLFGNTEFDADDKASASSNFDPNAYGFNGIRDAAGWQNIIASPVLDYCHNGDIFCGVSAKVSIGPASIFVRNFAHIAQVAAANGTTSLTAQHESYVTAGDADKAAARIASLIGVPAPAPTDGPSDTVFVIDSTGSMGGEIESVKNNVEQLANTIASKSPNFRFALVDYKDDASNDSAYQAQVDVPFTNNTDTFTAGVSSITASGGGDTPESMYSGIMAGLNLPWRTGVKKTVIVISDAPGKDPEPVTGYTLSQVTAKALSVDPAQIYGVEAGTDPDAQSFMQAVTDANGGTVSAADSSGSFLKGLESAILDAGNAPTAQVAGDTTVNSGVSTKFSAAGTTSDPSDLIVGYDWNFGTGSAAGTYDTTTTEPIVSTSFGKPGTYTVTVRARAKSGLVGLASTQITVTQPATAVPSAPTALAASAGDGTVTLTWSPGAGATPAYYLVKDGSGNTLDAFAPADPAAVQTWTDSELTNGTARTYSVYAANSVGLSGAAGPITVTPTGSSTTPTPPPTTGNQHAALAVDKTVARGKVLKVRGSHFDPRRLVALWMNDSHFHFTFTRTDRDGNFLAYLWIPRNTKLGKHTVLAWSGKDRASAQVTVLR